MNRRKFTTLIAGCAAAAMAGQAWAATEQFAGFAIPSAPPPPANALDLKTMFGCLADGSNEQAKIQAALDRARALGRPLYAPPGVYGHGDMLRVDGVELVGAGQTTEFRALNPLRSTIRLVGWGARLRYMKITSPFSRARDTTPNSTGVWGDSARNFAITAVTVERSASAGLFFSNCEQGWLTNTVASRTFADGHHFTNGCANIQVTDCRSIRTGDDGFAVVSYRGDKSERVVCRDIAFTRAYVDHGGARGCAVVGGRNISWTDCVVIASQAAGIYIASEGSYNTHGVENVRVQGGRIVDAVQKAGLEHPAVLLMGRSGGVTVGGVYYGAQVRGTIVTGLVITGAGVGMRDVIRAAAGSVNSQFRNITVSNMRAGCSKPLTGLAIGGQNVTASGLALSDLGNSALLVLPSAQGTIALTGSTVRGTALDDPLHRVINVCNAAPDVTKLAFTNNEVKTAGLPLVLNSLLFVRLLDASKVDFTGTTVNGKLVW